jgi:ferritin
MLYLKNLCSSFQSAYFDRDDVALQGFAKRFSKNSEEERCHAQKFIDYQNSRGGRIVFQVKMNAREKDYG